MRAQRVHMVRARAARIAQNPTRHFDDTPTTSAVSSTRLVSVVHVQPSSLIFVAIVAIWAAYLLQHWIRRRDALVTARTVDQFSEAMRMLEHRGATPVSGEAEHVGGVDAPAKPRASRSLPRTSLRAGTIMTGEEPQTTPESTPPESPEARPAPVRVGNRVIRALAALNSRRMRGIAFLVSMALLLFALIAAPLGMLAWWSPIISLVLVGVVFAWLRSEAVAEQRNRQAERAPSSAARPAVRREPTGPQLGATPAAAHERVPMPPRETVFDNAAPVDSPQAKPAPAAEQVEGGWSPVPVPPPTYTMKARAEQRTDAPAERPAPAAEDQTPVEDLPFDGLALDEDLEELPAAWRVG